MWLFFPTKTIPPPLSRPPPLNSCANFPPHTDTHGKELLDYDNVPSDLTKGYSLCSHVEIIRDWYNNKSPLLPLDLVDNQNTMIPLMEFMEGPSFLEEALPMDFLKLPMVLGTPFQICQSF
jgi:hypothetical protein